MDKSLKAIEKVYTNLGIQETASRTPRKKINTGTLNKKMSTYIVNSTSEKCITYDYKFK